MNLKNPMRRAEQEREDCAHAVYRNGVLFAEQEREDCAHAVYRNGVLFVSEVVVLRNIFKLKLNRCKKKRTNKVTVICLDQTRVTCCEWKESIPYLIPLLVVFIKDLDSRRITLKCENEPHTCVNRRHRHLAGASDEFCILRIPGSLPTHSVIMICC